MKEKVGSKIIFLSRDGDGDGDDFASAISLALLPQPNSSLQKTQTPFELSLEKYEIRDQKASGDIVNFVDSAGSIEVSILLMRKYEPPVAACAIKEVLESIIMAGNFSDMPTLILPCNLPTQKINKEIAKTKSTDEKVAVYGTHIGQMTDFTQAFIAGTSTLSPSVSISCELLACLLQMIHVLKLPTILLAGSSNSVEETVEQDHLVLCALGEFLASHTGLCFSKDKIRFNTIGKTRTAQEAWRALYG